MTNQEAIRILKSKMDGSIDTSYEWTEAVRMAIEALKSERPEDAVKVVRCRECEYWKCNPNSKNYGVCGKVSYDDFEVIMEGDDFCSYGIRIK